MNKMNDDDYHANQERLAARRARQGRRRRALELIDGFDENKRRVDADETYRAGGPKKDKRTASRTFEAKCEGDCARCTSRATGSGSCTTAMTLSMPSIGTNRSPRPRSVRGAG